MGAHIPRLAAAGVFLLLACGKGRSPTVDVDPNKPVPPSPAPPLCLWNQAYQENLSADTVDAIVAGAEGCYVLLDPFDEPAAAAAIPTLQAANNLVGCYISVGTCETWRSDYEDIRPYCTQKEWPEWPGEFFVSDVAGIVPWMQARIDRARDWGCDMIEFDNMDWALDPEQNQAFDVPVTPQDSIAYYRDLCDRVHQAGMKCMAKSTREGADIFDGGTFESAPDELDWWEHDHLQSFVDQGLPAVIFHYDEPDCDSVTLWYRQRYGAGLSVLCEAPAVGGYRHD